MARPTKEGLDYFPLDVDIDQDDKLIVPVAKYGIKGFGIVIKLMMEIYRNGYFYYWGEKEQYIFANRINVDINEVNEVINECIKWGFFNQELFEKWHILTSSGFQKRYLEACKRRKDVSIVREYVLIDLNDFSDKIKLTSVNSDKNEVNVDINSSKCINTSAESTQSKVKESKVNKNKEIISSRNENCEDVFEQEQVEKEEIPYAAIVSYLNEMTDKSYKPTTAKTQACIKARWREGFRLDDFKTVIRKKCAEWKHDEQMNKYLRPETLFGTKFESYLNQTEVRNNVRPFPNQKRSGHQSFAEFQAVLDEVAAKFGG